MGSEVFFLSRLIQPWEGLQQLHHTSTTRTKHRMINMYYLQFLKIFHSYYVLLLMPFCFRDDKSCNELYSSEISMHALSLSSFNSKDRMLLVEVTHRSGR